MTLDGAFGLTSFRPVPMPEHDIHLEELDYFSIGDASLWGEGDRATLALLSNCRIAGAWMDLACGDGRYTAVLLDRADHVIAADVDLCALRKLRYRTSEEHRPRLVPVVVDMSRPFPVCDSAVQGVLCTGILHLFHWPLIQRILKEIDRVVAPGGRVILDFGTDIVRQFPDGRRYVRKGTPNHDSRDASRSLRQFFVQRGYEVTVAHSTFEDDLSDIDEYGYVSRGKFVLLDGVKPSLARGQRR